jgi:hypothetical protein
MNASGLPSPDIMIVSVGINSVTSGVDAASDSPLSVRDAGRSEQN